MGVGETGVGEMGVGETGVGETGILGVIRLLRLHFRRINWLDYQ